VSTAAASSYAPGPEPVPPRRPARMRKVGAWVLFGLAALVVLVGIAITVVLRSARFHNYVLTYAQKKASENLGVQVQLQDFALHLSLLSPHLGLDLYGLTVHGAAPYSNLPLLQVAH
jgi:hypothetical protein